MRLHDLFKYFIYKKQLFVKFVLIEAETREEADVKVGRRYKEFLNIPFNSEVEKQRLWNVVHLNQ